MSGDEIVWRDERPDAAGDWLIDIGEGAPLRVTVKAHPKSGGLWIPKLDALVATEWPSHWRCARVEDAA